MGASVYVLATSGAYIKEFARFMWSLRDQFGYAIHILKDIDMDIRSQHTRPIVLNELSDCTFGGAAGDVMTTATYLVTHHIPKAAVVGIVDPGSVEQAFKVGVGVKEKFTIGGKICMKNNPSLKISAEVVSLHTNVCPKSHMEMESGMVFNRVAIISAEGVHLLLIEYPGPIGGPAFFDAVGLSATDYQVIVVKEGLNPFVTYNNVCEKILMVESPGFNPQRLTPDLFHHLNKKLYPIYSDVLDINL